MNYGLHYKNLIETRRNRIKDPNVYYERHHIRPRCIGGSDDESNLVNLTFREHFIAHWLLYKIAIKTNNKYTIFRIGLALQFMCCQPPNTNKMISSRQFEIVKVISLESAKLRFKVKEQSEKQKENFSFKGRVHSEETKQKMSNSHKGKTFSEEHKQKLSEIAKNRTFSEETKRKLSESAPKTNIGRTYSEETKRKISESAKNLEKIKCPHCGKECSPSNAVRWHFDNCKNK